VLRGLLKPDGLMRIGLYSQTGRRRRIAAQERSGGAAIRPRARACCASARRSALCDAATLNTLTRLKDYYQLSMYRDLLFHVREQRFDIPKSRRC
jgi:hypothetical protein